MKYDIITVTYNSSSWLENYFSSLEKLDYDKSRLRLIIVDNLSTDDTLNICNEYRKRSSLGEVKIIANTRNAGFGAGNNLGVKNGDAPFVLLLNVDTEIYADAFTELDGYIQNAGDDVSAFEMRQLPVEMGKHYDPVTLETGWASGACVAVRRTAYEAIGGFDENIFMYADDTDLSWRLRANGGRLIYCPKATVIHHGWQKKDGGRFEYIHSAYAKLLLAYKYGDMALIVNQNKEYLKTLRYPRHFAGVRKELAKLYLKHFTQIFRFTGWRRKSPDMFKAKVYDFRPGFAPERGQIVSYDPEINPLVSVVVRTHKRPRVLERTLACLYNQIYTNFEVVVIEDGAETAKDVVAKFSGLNIRYYSTGAPVGRGRAGNTGIEKSNGKYVCFLDDDDFLYADCISACVRKFQDYPGTEMVINGVMAFKNDVKSIDPYIYNITELYPVLFDHITLMDMCVKCRIPMTCCMFDKELYYRHGGMREDIGGDEDWAMWLKYMKDAVRINPYNRDINRALSMFGYPADDTVAKKREEGYRIFDRIMLYDESMVFTVPGTEIQKWESYVQADINHLKNIGRLDKFMADLKPLGIEKLEYTPQETYTLSAKQINNYYYWLVYDYTGTEKPTV